MLDAVDSIFDVAMDIPWLIIWVSIEVTIEAAISGMDRAMAIILVGMLWISPIMSPMTEPGVTICCAPV
jgi:hypothetical protein